jgi:hypothetical protein
MGLELMAKKRRHKFACGGCQIASEGLFESEECVHDEGCMFYDPYDPNWERVTIPKSELKLLCEIALAAELADKTGNYTHLKVLLRA